MNKPIPIRNKLEFERLKIGSIVNVKKGDENTQLSIYEGKKDCGESFISQYYNKDSVVSIRSPLEKIIFFKDGIIRINRYEYSLFVYEPDKKETLEEYKTSKKMLEMKKLWRIN